MEAKLTQTKSVRGGGRNSGIDLLRIIAILCICLFHANQTVREIVDADTLGFASKAASYFLAQLGQIGNMLFVICSSYYLVDSTRSRGEKALGILLDSMLISSCYIVGYLSGGYSFSWREIISHFFPDLFGQLWFIPCYVMFYLFAPIVGIGLKKLGKKVHLAYCLGLLIVYGGLALVGRNPLGSSFLGFFFLFGLVAYEKWYMPSMFASVKKNLILSIGAFVVSYGLYFAWRLICPHIGLSAGYFSPIGWHNPFTLVGLICFFNLFAMMKFKNRLISYFGSSSLFVYCIHENALIRTITRVDFYNIVFERFGQQQYVLWALLCGLFMFVAGFLLAVVYRETLHRLTNWVARKLGALGRKIYNWFYNKFIEKPSSES